MWRKIAIIIPGLIIAFGILFTSILRTAQIKYEFSDIVSSDRQPSILGAETVDIKYNLAYPGKVLPDSSLWPLKALRDRIWLAITTNASRKAELKMLFADKRVAMSKILFEREKYEIGYSTLTKAGKYLEQAYDQTIENEKQGDDTSEFLKVLAIGSLKHRQAIEEMLLMAPEDAKPNIIRTRKYSIDVFQKAKQALNEKRNGRSRKSF